MYEVSHFFEDSKMDSYTDLIVPNAPFFYSLKISENLTVFWCFKRVQKGALNKWVNNYQICSNELFHSKDKSPGEISDSMLELITNLEPITISFFVSNMLKPGTLLKVTLLHRRFSYFLNCANGTKSRKTPHLL